MAVCEGLIPAQRGGLTARSDHSKLLVCRADVRWLEAFLEEQLLFLPVPELFHPLQFSQDRDRGAKLSTEKPGQGDIIRKVFLLNL